MPNRIGLPVEQWPVADKQAWLEATTAEDYFSDTAHAAHWRPKTRYQAMTAYGRWLAFLGNYDPTALQCTPHERACPQLLQPYLDELGRRVRPMSVVAELNHLRHALRAIAPELSQVWLATVQRSWTRQARPREKRSKMIEPARLIALGKALMEAARQCSDARQGARDYRDGLLIALLTARPLRRRNLAELEFGKQVMRTAQGWLLVLDGDSMKGGEPLEFTVPDDLLPYLDEYIDRYRPQFPGASGHASLWPSSKGGRLGDDAIYDLVCRRTRAAFGITLSPHLFRSIAATAIARHAPTQVLIARDLLGHANVDTTDRHYRRSKSIEASRRHTEIIAALRKL